MEFEVGQIIRCKEKHISQKNFGTCTGDLSDVIVGEMYTISEIDVHGWHTKLFLEGIVGSFNSVMFEATIYVY